MLAFSRAPEESTGIIRPAPRTDEIRVAERELAVLVRALDAAAAGVPGICVVEGEAGIGKTRLVEELAAAAHQRDCVVVWGRSLEGDAAPAYWPWLAALRALRAWCPNRTNTTVDRLVDATGTAPNAPLTDERGELFDGVLRFLGPAHADGCTDHRPDGHADRPLVIVLEDMQWADAESLELTARLASGLSGEPVLIVVTIRDGNDADRDAVIALLAAVSRRRGTHRVRLVGLDAAGTAALLGHASGGTIDDRVAGAVHARSDGNPFYAIELQRLLDSEGLVDPAAIAAAGIPVGVRDVVRQRLRRIAQPTLDLLRLAAVAGRDIDVALLSRASGRPLDQCLEALEVAIEHRLLTDGGPGTGLRFAHALVREIVADELSSLRRAQIHLVLADAIMAAGNRDDETEIVAEHLCAAVPIGAGGRAAAALDRAADVAIARFAVDSACDLLTRSLALHQSTGAGAGDELDTLVKLVWALRARGGYSGGLAHYRRGAELARLLGRHDVEVEMQWAEWAANDTACEFDRARPVAIRFREWAASSDDPVVRLAGSTAWAIQCWHDGALAESAAAFQSVANLRSAVAARAGTVSLAAELCLLSTGFGLYLDEQVGWLLDPDAAFTATAESVQDNFGAAMLWALACTSAASAGALDRVERYSRRVLAAEAGETLGFWGSQARMYLGAALTATGRALEGRPLFNSGHAGYAAAGMHTGAALMLAFAASAEVIAGDLDRACVHLGMAQSEL
ncbi:MAG TPA: AAA family ATPase, partial [Ilumatobacteraceae bacterium]|nr:AAA family ATPase [Ilumatobacteraceae bacterium]